MNYTKKPTETLTITVPLTSRLSGCELLTGTPTVVEVGSADLTIASVALNSTAWPCNQLTANWWEWNFLAWSGASVPANGAVQFSVSGGTTRTAYTLRITVSSDGTPAQTFVEDIRLQVT